MFGGLEICAVEAVVGKDGRENIIEADDCAMSLMGETQEEDRRLISDLGMISLTHKRFPFFMTLRYSHVKCQYQCQNMHADKQAHKYTWLHTDDTVTHKSHRQNGSKTQ